MPSTPGKDLSSLAPRLRPRLALAEAHQAAVSEQLTVTGGDADA